MGKTPFQGFDFEKFGGGSFARPPPRPEDLVSFRNFPAPRQRRTFGALVTFRCARRRPPVHPQAAHLRNGLFPVLGEIPQQRGNLLAQPVTRAAHSSGRVLADTPSECLGFISSGTNNAQIRVPLHVQRCIVCPFSSTARKKFTSCLCSQSTDD